MELLLDLYCMVKGPCLKLYRHIRHTKEPENQSTSSPFTTGRFPPQNQVEAGPFSDWLTLDLLKSSSKGYMSQWHDLSRSRKLELCDLWCQKKFKRTHYLLRWTVYCLSSFFAAPPFRVMQVQPMPLQGTKLASESELGDQSKKTVTLSGSPAPQSDSHLQSMPS